MRKVCLRAEIQAFQEASKDLTLLGSPKTLIALDKEVPCHPLAMTHRLLGSCEDPCNQAPRLFGGGCSSTPQALGVPASWMTPLRDREPLRLPAGASGTHPPSAAPGDQFPVASQAPKEGVVVGVPALQLLM